MADETLKKLHAKLLMLLDEVDRICRENDIAYFLDSGTALGAIRHKGFIPWDDDADVGMLREDYEKIITAAKTQLGSQFFLQTHETDPGYLKFNAKIRLNDTYFPERLNEKEQLHQGIFIDIFPFDFTSADDAAARKDTDRIRRIYRTWMIRENNSVNDGWLRKAVRKCFKIISAAKLQERYNRVCLKYDHTDQLTCYAYKMNDNHYLYFDYDDLKEVTDIDFEGHTYMIMRGYDNYLRTMFGDYMALPPEENRVAHFLGGIVFGKN